MVWDALHFIDLLLFLGWQLAEEELVFVQLNILLL